MPADASKGKGLPPDALEKLDLLRSLLRRMFQLDRGDLDFGLYRIMNLKSAEIAAFLDRDLLPQVRSDLGFAPEPEVEGGSPQARQVEEGENQKDDPHAEADVYQHLATFFSRYYDEGDFLSRRRHSGDGRPTYLIPYDGEEVKLHWANSDQYYIKTTDRYSAYRFSLGEGRHARFEVAAATPERDGIEPVNGRERRFVLDRGEEAVTVSGDDLVVRFEHRPLTEDEKRKWPGNGINQQARINETASARIAQSAPGDWPARLLMPAPTEANGGRTLLAKHLDRYTAKNTFDYFIHKDLGGFLNGQLDFYLNTEVLDMEAVERGDRAALDRSLARARATSRLGRKIIAFLSQLEDFQKKLWLKKKFVLETQWCVTLDRIPETLYPEIAANDAQREEWARLFAIRDIQPSLDNGGECYSEPLTVEFLRANRYLVLDTKHFTRDFTDRLLGALSDAGPLEEGQDGLVIHGENFQALNLLRPRYRGSVDCIYIDPPYNTGYSQILYKNTFKHSSWLSLMENRLEISRDLATAKGSHIVAIDENEQEVLGQLLGALFPEHERVCVSVVHNKKGIQGAFFSYTHDYAFFLLPQALGATNPIEVPAGERRFENLRKWGRESDRATARNCFYPILVEDDEIVGFGEVCGDDFHPGRGNVVRDGRTWVYPVDAKGEEKKWRYARGSVEGIRHLLRVKRVKKTGEIQIEKCRTERQVKTVWDDARYIAGDHGTRRLTDLGVKVDDDLYPKSVHTVSDSVSLVCGSDATVLDYFAGSGTTGHAVLELNRRDDGNRRFVLVEMGDHFDTVLLPRLKKAAYSSGWKEGRPAARDGRSCCFRYLRLESYEDTMEGLSRVAPNERARALLLKDAALREDYLLRYCLGTETAASASLLGEEFRDPFAYRLEVVRDGTRREVAVDLVETFNLLLGLRVESRRRLDGVVTVSGVDREGRRTLILWRNLETTDRPALEAWFEKHRERVVGSAEVIYTNGDHCLNALRRSVDAWTGESLDARFRQLMFEEDD